VNVAAVSTMRLKVSIGPQKLVIPVPDPSVKVSKLAEDIAARFKINRIKELVSDDGFLFNFDDVVSQVMKDGDIVIGSDYQMWVDQTAKACNNRWLRISRVDYGESDDGETRWIDVGWSDGLAKLYVQLGKKKYHWAY